MLNGIFITGTNTGVGKTCISAMLMHACEVHGLTPRYYKPIQTGSDIDQHEVARMTNLTDQHFIASTYTFSTPAAPSRAAEIENEIIDINKIERHVQTFSANCFHIIEGAGGLMVPITPRLLIRDLISRFNLPTLIVATTQLGTINHTLLTLEAAAKANILVKGIILVGDEDVGLSECIANFTPTPIIAEIPWIVSMNSSSLQACALKHFSKKLLEDIFDHDYQFIAATT